MLSKLKPDFYITSIYKIDLQALKEKGYKAIICDLDNTLLPWHSFELNQQLEHWLKSIQAAGFKILLVSNAKQARIEQFCRSYNVEGIAMARKPLKGAFRKALQKLNVSSHETIMVGDQLFTDVFGAKRAGIAVILVVPLSNKDMILTRGLRILERRLLKKLKLKPQ